MRPAARQQQERQQQRPKVKASSPGEALGARLPADFDEAEVAAIAEPPLEPAAPPPVVARPPPPLITGPSLLPAFLQDKLKGDFL